MTQLINSFGLVLGITGAGILFKWGFPQPSFEEGVGLGLEDSNVLENGLTVAENNQKIREEKERFTRISRLGLALIIIGFAFQLVAVWL
ncbi:MAG: hypothetical protein U0V02_21325 [Anaerolineales bacterium]